MYTPPMLKWLEFFLTSITPKLRSHTGSEVFLISFFIHYIFSMRNETKEDEFHLGPNRFFHPPPQKLLSLGHIRAYVKAYLYSEFFRR